MQHKHSNIVLIGMPGAGKSTIGVILARMTARDFIDTDVSIQTAAGRTLQDIVDVDGYAALRKIEEDILLGLSLNNYVIATGGSAVYSSRAMAHFKSNSILIFLDVSIETLEARVHDFSTRGLAKPPDQSFDDLFAERLKLYREYANITIACNGLTQEEVCEQIISTTNAKH